MESNLNGNVRHFDTIAIHGGHSADDYPQLPIIEPLVCSATYKQLKPGVIKAFNYGRNGNPNRSNLESLLAGLENAKYCAVFPSGSSVVYAIGNLFQHGAHFIVANDLYGGTLKCLGGLEKKHGYQVEYVDLTNPDVFKSQMRKDTKLIWLESPTNPTLTVVDIKEICDIAKKINPEVVIVVDNTFMTSYFQRPLELGADVSMYSLTKYINGHADVILGAAVTNCQKLYEEFRVMQEVNGLIPSPYDCHKISRDAKTLGIRMEQHQRNAMKIAEHLEKSPFVTKVNHTGLASHPSHNLAIRQAKGHSGIMSFCIKGGLPEVEKFMDHLKIIQCAPSVGSVETLAASPALMIHNMISQEQRDKMGITDSMIRLSVGIENVDDLIGDLQQALEKVNF